MMNVTDLKKLSRAELRNLAKVHKINANLKSDAIIARLLEYARQELPVTPEPTIRRSCGPSPDVHPPSRATLNTITPGHSMVFARNGGPSGVEPARDIRQASILRAASINFPNEQVKPEPSSPSPLNSSDRVPCSSSRSKLGGINIPDLEGASNANAVASGSGATSLSIEVTNADRPATTHEVPNMASATEFLDNLAVDISNGKLVFDQDDTDTDTTPADEENPHSRSPTPELTKEQTTAAWINKAVETMRVLSQEHRDFFARVDFMRDAVYSLDKEVHKIRVSVEAEQQRHDRMVTWLSYWQPSTTEWSAEELYEPPGHTRMGKVMGRLMELSSDEESDEEEPTIQPDVTAENTGHPNPTIEIPPLAKPPASTIDGPSDAITGRLNVNAGPLSSGRKRSRADEDESLQDRPSQSSKRSHTVAPREDASGLKRALDADEIEHPDDPHVQGSKRLRTVSSRDTSAAADIASSSKGKGKAVDRSSAGLTPDLGKSRAVSPLPEDEEELEDYVDSESIRVMLDEVSDASKESPKATKTPVKWTAGPFHEST